MMFRQKKIIAAAIFLLAAAVSWGHLQSSVGGYPKIVHSLNMKKGRSDTPLS